MTSAGVTIVADGTNAADDRLSQSLDNDTGLSVIRYADASYAKTQDEIASKGIHHVQI